MGLECWVFLQRIGVKDVDEFKKYFYYVMFNFIDCEGLNVVGWLWGDGVILYDWKDFFQNR